MKPKISICVVTYNHEKYIAECLESIFKQTCIDECEILIGEDHSTDTTGTIVDRFTNSRRANIRVERGQSNLGSSENFRLLLKKARGRYIAVVDGDDFWSDAQKLEKQVKFLENNNGASAVYTNAVVIGEQKEIKAQFCNDQLPLMESDYLIAEGNFLCHSTLMFRREKLTHLIRARNLIDYSIQLILAENASIGYIADVTTAYRQGSATSMLQSKSNYVNGMLWSCVISHTKCGTMKRFAAGAFFLSRYLLPSSNRSYRKNIREFTRHLMDLGPLDIAFTTLMMPIAILKKIQKKYQQAVSQSRYPYLYYR